MIRRFFVWLHRWAGLLIATFLIVEGFTGCLLAFNGSLTRALNSKLFASEPAPNAQPLDLATLAEKAEAINPAIRVVYFAGVANDQAVLRCTGAKDPKTHQEIDIGFMYMVLDPYTGKELGRLRWCGYDINGGFIENIMPFLFDLHMSLALGELGSWILSVVALIWSIDCFIGFYLTLPVTRVKFWSRWKIAWFVKWRAGIFRTNFDLHRAGGLWFWIAMFIFAWSSVNLVDRMGVYEVMTRTLFRSPPVDEWITEFYPDHPVANPKLKWREAQAAGEKLMTEYAKAEGFKIVRPIGLSYFEMSGLYNYIVQTDRVFPHDKEAAIFFDANTGDFYRVMASVDPHFGETVTNWLRALHMIKDPVAYLPYRILVSITGLVIVMLSFTGIYIWWKKRKARLLSISLWKTVFHKA